MQANNSLPPILVTGGTGTLGRLLVPRLLGAGRSVRILARHAGPATENVEYAVGDLETDTGIDAAVTGIETVVHCAGSAKHDGDKARSLVRAAAEAGVKHIVYISVVGADRVPVVSGIDRGAFGYFAGKREGELAIEQSGTPWTTLRATQFHDLALLTASALGKLPMIPVPSGARFQPVDAAEVADRLAELALGDPAGLVPDVAGPRIYSMGDLIRSYLRAAGKRRLMFPVRVPGGASRAISAGANLAPDHATGKVTWEEFLAAHVTSGRQNQRPEQNG
jgi:uncharacterized protein YbjT (DUF2867 family)